jgi:hypothetical protein
VFHAFKRGVSRGETGCCTQPNGVLHPENRGVTRQKGSYLTPGVARVTRRYNGYFTTEYGVSRAEPWCVSRLSNPPWYAPQNGEFHAQEKGCITPLPGLLYAIAVFCFARVFCSCCAVHAPTGPLTPTVGFTPPGCLALSAGAPRRRSSPWWGGGSDGLLRPAGTVCTDAAGGYALAVCSVLTEPGVLHSVGT